MPIFSHSKFTWVSTISFWKQEGYFYSSDKERQHTEVAYFSRHNSALRELTSLALVLLVLRKSL